MSDSHPSLTNTPLAIHGCIKRRRVLPMAAAALSLAGCGLSAQQAGAPGPQTQEAQQRVKQYQADIEQTLDLVDRERLRAAAQRKPTPPAPPSAVAATAPATTPAGSQTPVILASAGNGETPAAAHPAAEATPKTEAVPATAPAFTAVKPATVLPAAEGIPAIDTVAPLAGDAGTVRAAVIAPFTPPATPSASAMGSMTALAKPEQIAAGEPAVAGKAGGGGEASLDDALAVVRKNADEHPTLNAALALALLNDSKAGDIGKKLSATDQKVLGDLVAALETMKGPGGGAEGVGGGKGAETSLAQRAAPLLDAVKGWQQEADLALPRMVLATRVDSFGVFTPVTGTFEQGKRHTVIIYCEVANFAAKKGDDGFFTTKLAQQETLITEDGLLVWRPNPEDIEDRSLNQRHDFYLVKKLTIPETLAAGKYTLRMSVTDRTTNKIAVVSLPVEIMLKP